ncbi:cell division protein FtsA [Candidatus Nomurabacteria bacterium]|nr:cell division protein FtsA [Candidatus Nomurabacteria bacterium]
MRKHYAVGIDIGTHNVKVIVTENNDINPAFPKIIGAGFAESKGLRHGYIINQTEAVRSIRKAVRQAEKKSGIRISRAFLSVGGIGLASYVSTGTIMISRADSEITELDIEKVLEDSERQIPPTISINRKIIHTIPLEYLVDSKPVFGNPVGLKGAKLEAKVLFITCLEHHLAELINTVEEADIEIIDVMAAPLAASLVTLSKPEKIAGCVLTNIGSETVSIVVYENDLPVSLEIFPIGSNDITNDIALGLQIPLNEAEDAKRDLNNEFGENKYPKKKLEEIIGARLSDIFELIESHLKKISKNGLLPAGIVITGGGSGITTIEDLAKAYLKLPSKVSHLACNSEIEECINEQGVKIKDGQWAVSYGLCVFGLYADDDTNIQNNIGKKFLKSTRKKIASWLKQFLP